MAVRTSSRAIYASLTKRLVTLALVVGVTASQSACLTIAAYARAQDETSFDAMSALDHPGLAWSLRDGVPLAGRLIVMSEYENAYGQLRRVESQMLTCAGRTVTLAPDTDQMRWQVQRLYGLRVVDPADWIEALSPPGLWPAEWSRYVRTVTCNSKGGFSFPSVPAGRYLLIAQLDRRQPAHGSESGYVLKLVSVRSGQRLDLTLRSNWTSGPFIPR